jgi:hypothetical protein
MVREETEDPSNDCPLFCLLEIEMALRIKIFLTKKKRAFGFNFVLMEKRQIRTYLACQIITGSPVSHKTQSHKLF